MGASQTHKILEHHSQSRTLRHALIMTAVWGVIVLLWLLLDAADWIVAVLLATTLPAALDFARNRQASLRLDDTQLRWRSGRSQAEVSLHRIDRVRFETRLDLSIRVRLVLDSSKRLSIPQDALPDIEELQKAFDERGVKWEKHHFGFL
ncbi:MAG: hypothetical protein JXQ89_10085 [Pelagimonas sp.]